MKKIAMFCLMLAAAFTFAPPAMTARGWEKPLPNMPLLIRFCRFMPRPCCSLFRATG